MSKTSKIFSLFVWVTTCFFASCERKAVDPPETGTEPPGGDTTKIPPKPQYYDENTWIYEQMTMNYLWAEEMPDEDSTDKNLAPIKYFHSLLYKEKDRYSYAKENYEEIADYWNGQMEAYGFRYKKLQDSAGEYKVVVSLVLKGSPAEEAGLERGDCIVGVDGTKPEPGNTEDLFARKSAVFNLVTATDSMKTLNMAKRRFQVNPLQHYRIVEWRGKKVGYLVYTQFLFNYEAETQRIFQYFKDNAIDEMVLDLRFNPGGVTPIAEVMASLLGPDLGSTAELYHSTTNAYESQQAQQNGTVLDTRRYFTNETVNLSGLKRLFVLTSRSSASSSELVINCLRPYRPVLTVGGHTYGKNVISTIVKNDKYSFTLMPAWRSILNVRNESAYGVITGLPADFHVQENVLPYRPLGDSTETLLAAALAVIGGDAPAQKGTRQANVLDGFHHFDTGTSFLGNKRYNP